jgi:predicted ribonuclease YlaK
MRQGNHISQGIMCNVSPGEFAYKPGDYIDACFSLSIFQSENGDMVSMRIKEVRPVGMVEKMIDDGTIILLPMSDIRGYDTTGMRAGIYISEAQNMDIELMRLALQRIGEDSICILDGDSDTQVDLSIYAGNNNGMRRVSEIFKGHDIYGEVTLQKIYRSKIAELAQLM